MEQQARENVVSFIECLWILDPASAWEILGGLRKVLEDKPTEELLEKVKEIGKEEQLQSWLQRRSLLPSI